MELRLLRYFIAVAELGSVRQRITGGEPQAGRDENSPTWRGISTTKRKYMAAA